MQSYARSRRLRLLDRCVVAMLPASTADTGSASPATVVHLTSVVNDPNEAASLSDSLYDLLYASFVETTPEVPPLAPGVLAEVTPADFSNYLRRLASTWPAFVAAREACGRGAEDGDDLNGEEDRSATAGASCSRSGL